MEHHFYKNMTNRYTNNRLDGLDSNQQPFSMEINLKTMKRDNNRKEKTYKYFLIGAKSYKKNEYC